MFWSQRQDKIRPGKWNYREICRNVSFAEQPAFYTIILTQCINVKYTKRLGEEKTNFFRFFHWDLAKMKRKKAFWANLFNSQWERKHWRTCILAVCKWDRKSSIETFILGPTYMYICIHHTYIDISIHTTHSIDSQAKMYSSHIRAQRTQRGE